MENKEVIFLIGLPGSGKTYWMNNNKKENSYYADDISQTDKELYNLKIKLEDPKINLIYISDVNFLSEGLINIARKKIQNLTKTNLNFKNIFFIGKYEDCCKNVKLRNDNRNVEGTLKIFQFSNIYKIWENDINSSFILIKDYSKEKYYKIS